MPDSESQATGHFQPAAAYSSQQAIMVSRRSSHRLDRRRRVLVDESRTDATYTPRIFRTHDDSGPTSRYTNSALNSMQAPIAAYVPLRRFSLLVWLLTGLIPIVGLVALDSYRSQWVRVLGNGGPQAFDFAASGSLANWLSSMAFASATLLMLGIYSVRQHRRDDHRARFTVWRWAMIAAAFASIDATAGLHRTWQAICQAVFYTPLVGDGSIWWVATWSIVFGGIILRLMFEMRASRLSITWTGIASVAYLVSALLQIGLVPPNEELSQLVLTTTTLLGHHLFLFAILCYARHVVLEAKGELVTASKGRRKEADAIKKQSESALTAAEKRPQLRAVSAEDGEVKPADPAKTERLPKPQSVSSLKPSTADDNEEVDLSTLSKSERKRLRKEKRRLRAA